MSPKMSREQVVLSSSQRSNRRLPTTRPDKPSPIPEVLVKSPDNRELFHKQRRFLTKLIANSLHGGAITIRQSQQEEESVVARNTDGSIELRFDQVRN